MATGALRVLVYARYPAVRAGLRELLTEAGFVVTAELGANESAGPVATADVLVADLGGDRGEPTLLEDLAASLPAVYLVDGPAAVDLALHGAARGWLPRDVDADALEAAVRAVAAGMLVLDPAVAPAGLGSVRPPTVDASLATLTERELDVLRLVAVGLPNKGIALELGISEHTVKFHLGSVLSKLDARSRTEAVTLAARRGLLTL